MRCRSPAHLRRLLADTLDLTLWCLGCDVRHPEGNLLVARGFARVRPPAGHVGASMYTGPDRPPRSSVGDARQPTFAVWGFGLFLGAADHAGGVLLRRHDAAGARLTDTGTLPAPVWRPDALPPAAAVASAADALRAAALLAAVAERVAAHERWVAACCGAAYRRACAAQQPRHVRRRQRLGTEELVTAWLAASDAYAALGAPTCTTDARRAAPRRRATA